MGHVEHRAGAPQHARLAVLSVSSTRSLTEDESGRWMVDQAEWRGHAVTAHQVVPDDVAAIRQALSAILADAAPDVLIVTGGTGISPRDVTIEALQPLFSKELSGFGHLFSNLSYQEIQAAAIISRATAGIIGRAIVFCLPGSLKACQLACNNLIFPEIGHLLAHALSD